MDLVQAHLGRSPAVAWSRIIFLDLLRLGGSPQGLDLTVAHEVAHQWWGGILGVDSNDHTFMNESTATYASVLYLERTVGNEAARAALEAQAVSNARALLEAGDAVVDIPSREGQDLRERVLADYGKGPLGLLAIRREIGDEAFFAALRSYGEDHRFRIAEPADLLAAFEDASGKELDALWRHWFEAEELTAEEIEAIAGG